MTKNKMKSFVASISVGLACVFATSLAQAETPLEGAWIVSSWESLSGNSIADPQPGIFVFTGTNYSIMYVNTAEPRPEYDDDAGQTDAETLASYASLTANSGGYEIDGNTFTTYAYVAKDNNYMSGFPENDTVYKFERDGENLTITSKTFPQPFTVMLERVEGKDGPWETEDGE